MLFRWVGKLGKIRGESGEAGDSGKNLGKVADIAVVTDACGRHLTPDPDSTCSSVRTPECTKYLTVDASASGFDSLLSTTTHCFTCKADYICNLAYLIYNVLPTMDIDQKRDPESIGGTAKLEASGSEASHMEELAAANAPSLSPEHAEFLMRRHGTLNLNPVPSMSPADPLNWPSWKVHNVPVAESSTIVV